MAQPTDTNSSVTRQVWLSRQEIDEIVGCVARGEPVIRELPAGGYLHIDRALPFLCLYHRTTQDDAGAVALLGGQASYVILPDLQTSEDQTSDDSAKALLTRLLAVLGEKFGAVAVLELRTTAQIAESPKATGTLPTALVRLWAPQHGAPLQVLETFERAASATKWPIPSPVVEVRYAPYADLPGPARSLSETELKTLHVTYLVLELSAVFRDFETGEVFPQILRDLQVALGHVTKQMFYCFALDQATFHPAHHLELGGRTLADVVGKVDQAFAEISDSFDLLLHVTPVNADQALVEFQQSGYDRCPEFHYRALRVDPAALKRALYTVPLEDIEDPALHRLFSDKRDELDTELSLMRDRGTEGFRFGSLRIFGMVDDDLLALARTLLSMVPHPVGDMSAEDWLDAEEFATHARAEVERYRKTAADLTTRVEVRDDVAGILVSKGNFLIGTGSRVARSRVAAALSHEVGTHALTFYNGLQQPIQQLHSGLARYEELQEGLAVLSEYLVGGLTASRIRQLAGRVIAVHAMSDGADFISTYRLLCRQHGFPPAVAYSMVMRAFRGGGHAKDQIYLRGLAKLLGYLGDGGSLDTLLLGKVGFGQLDLVEELAWRGVLSDNILRPRYLENPDAVRRLEEIRSGKSVIDLVTELAS